MMHHRYVLPSQVKEQARRLIVMIGLLATIVATIVAADPKPALAAKIRALSAWDGSNFSDKDGGAFFKLDLGGVKTSSPAAMIQFLVVDLLTKQKLVIKTSQGQFAEGKQPPVWRLPAGKYALIAVRLQAEKNAKGEKAKPQLWKADAKTAPRLIIKRQAVAHLGTWELKQRGKAGLGLEMVPPTSLAAAASGLPSRYAIYHGLDGALLLAAQSGSAAAKPEPAADAAAPTKQLHTLLIKWRFELLKDNDLAGDLEKAITQRDVELRACYASELAKKKGLKGDLHFVVAISKKSGHIQKIKAAGGELNQPSLAECLAGELTKVKFVVTRNAVGKLFFTFDVS